MSFSTATWMPVAPAPAAPMNAIAWTIEFRVALTSIVSDGSSLPAVILAFPPTRASTLLELVITSTAAPTPTKPPAAAPARPWKNRSSFARTRTLPPATTVPSIDAAVPSAAGEASALAVGDDGAAAAIEAFAPLVTALIRLFVIWSLAEAFQSFQPDGLAVPDG